MVMSSFGARAIRRLLGPYPAATGMCKVNLGLSFGGESSEAIVIVTGFAGRGVGLACGRFRTLLGDPRARALVIDGENRREFRHLRGPLKVVDLQPGRFALVRERRLLLVRDRVGFHTG